MKKNLSILISCLLFTFALSVSVSCTDNSQAPIRLSNSAHLDHLCEDIEVNDIKMTIVHIYAEYPDYHWVDDADEGTACVDDAARAAVYYLRDYTYNNDETSLERTKNLLEFLLYMQDESGYFYNFIFPDHTINREHKNSINRPGWWSWRALWALTEAYPVLKNTDSLLAEKYMIGIMKSISALKDYLILEGELEDIEGFKMPNWLPYQYASDQAALLVMCFSNYYNITKDDSILDYINVLADGIMLMQVNEEASDYFGAMFSWKNLWHAWGNLQSYSLLTAYQITNKSEYLDSALREINHFYQYLYKIKYLNEYSLHIENNQLGESDRKVYSQIAYGFRPMVFAALEAHKITSEKKYAQYAANYANWFFGDNDQNEQMYFPDTGICYDGLNENSVNTNSGAESTVEALLLLQEIEQNNIAFTTLINRIYE